MGTGVENDLMVVPDCAKDSSNLDAARDSAEKIPTVVPETGQVEEAAETAETAEAAEDAAEAELAKKLKEWVTQQVDAEVARVEACGQKISKLGVKNCSILRPKAGTVVNRVEIDSSLDFDTVKQILLSDAISIPLEEKKGFSFCFVILSTGKSTVYIVPYIFDTSIAGNKLQDWNLVNNKLKTSHHRINTFEGVNAEEQDEQEEEVAPKPKGRRQPVRPSRKGKK